MYTYRTILEKKAQTRLLLVARRFVAPAQEDGAIRTIKETYKFSLILVLRTVCAGQQKNRHRLSENTSRTNRISVL